MRVTTTVIRRPEKLTFSCSACGYSAPVEVMGVGEGESTELNKAGTGEARAQAAARRDAADTLALARCRRCNRRSPSAAPSFWLKWAAMFAAALLTGIAVGAMPMLLGAMTEKDQAMALWTIPLLFTGSAAVVIAPMAHAKWVTIDSRVTWLE